MATPTTVTWNIDAAHTHVEFAVKHMMFSTVKGSFADVKGTITEHATDKSLSSVQAEVTVNSISTGDEKRDGHLRSADFFDVETYPTISFKSTKVEHAGGDHYKVYGDFTMHGVTKEIVFNAEFTGTGKNPWGATVMGLTAETKINRKDFNLNWNAALETGGVLVGEEVKLTLDVEATAAA